MAVFHQIFQTTICLRSDRVNENVSFFSKNKVYNEYCEVDLTEIKTFNFIKPDEKRFKALKIFTL